jgi:hypothetical protein
MLQAVRKGCTLRDVRGASGTVDFLATVGAKPFAKEKRLSQAMSVSLALGIIRRNMLLLTRG